MKMLQVIFCFILLFGCSDTFKFDEAQLLKVIEESRLILNSDVPMNIDLLIEERT